MKNHLTLPIVFILFISACSTTETVTEREPDQPIFDVDEVIADVYLMEEELSEYDLFLYEKRSYLSDQFAMLSDDMPEIFLKEVIHDEQDADPYAGYRVQVLSTREVSVADSVRDEFMAWASAEIAGYNVEAYVQFRQPTYRVRAGDFRDRNKAIEFSRIIKNKYPEAWVVHDRIDPDRVPSDTTEIRREN